MRQLRTLAVMSLLGLLAGCGTQATRTELSGAAAAEGSAASAAVPSAWTPIGASVENRPLLAAQSGKGALRVYVIGGIHGDEVEGRSELESLRTQARAGATLRIVRDLNPDGTAAGRRGNANGYDLNRNWPATNFQALATGGPAPLSEPETRALARDLQAFRPDLVLVLHSIAAGPLVNFDGPADRLAQAFADAARQSHPDWRVEPDMGYPTPGSLGSYLGVDRKIPILTIEFARGQDEASASASLRRGLAAAIAEAAGQARQLSSEGGHVPEYQDALQLRSASH
jgi:predicted deacylase